MQKSALITGGGRGIGLGIAQSLAAEGTAIAILDVLPQDSIQKNLDQLKAEGVPVLYCQGDVTSAADRQDALDRIKAEFGDRKSTRLNSSHYS